jgi:microcystin-dependent protein
VAADFTTYKVNSAETSNASKFDAFVQAVQDSLNAIGDTSKMAGSRGQIIDLSRSSSPARGRAGDVMTWNGSAWAPADALGGVDDDPGWGDRDVRRHRRRRRGGCSATAPPSHGRPMRRCSPRSAPRTGTATASTTFNVPDLRGRMPVGYAASGGHANVSTLGNNDGSALANRRPKHQHDVYDPGHTHSYNSVDVNKATAGVDRDANIVGGTTGSQTTGVKVNPGGLSSSSDPNNAPAYVVVNFIVKSS